MTSILDEIESMSRPASVGPFMGPVMTPLRPTSAAAGLYISSAIDNDLAITRPSSRMSCTSPLPPPLPPAGSRHQYHHPNHYHGCHQDQLIQQSQLLGQSQYQLRRSPLPGCASEFDQAAEWFGYMDTILTTNGLNIFSLPGRLASVRWMLRSASLMYSHLLLCHSVLTYVNRMDDPYSLLYLMQLFFSVVSFQSILRNRSKIAGIVDEICRCSSSHMQVCLKNLSKVIFLLWLMVLTMQLSLLSCQWYFIGTGQWMKQVIYAFEGPVSTLHHFLVVSDITFWVIYVIGFIVGSICVFVYILMCLNKLYMCRMRQLSEKLDYGQTLAKNLECFREIRAKYQGLKEASNDIFGLTVCGYFAECYLETGLRLANDDNKAEKSLHSLVTDWGLYGLQVLLLLAFILFLSKLSDKEENSEKRLLRKIISNKTRNYDIDYQKMMLIMEISQSPIVPVTGWNVFVINRSLLLGFLGSVIPFAVLIASLFEKTKQSMMPLNHCSNYTQLLESLIKSRNFTL